jgi:poly(3-hydroxybutyrate) depolymerase
LNSRFIVNQLLLTITGGGGTPNPAARVTDTGLNGGGHPFFTFDSVAGESYEIQCSTNLVSWTPMATLSGTGNSITYTDEFTQAPSAPKKFHRALTVQTPNGNLTNTTLSINQTWAQQPSGLARTALVQVPSGAGPHPVVILLHGNGGTGTGTIGALNPYLNNAIRVAPNGYLTSWNVDAETSKAPDVAFIRDLISLLKIYDNVDAGRISIFGNSNGAGLTNRLIVELDGAAFQNAGTQVSQMITKMNNTDSFWYNAADTNDYNQTIVPAKRRRIININGTADPTVPYNGGTNMIGTFMHSQESIYRFAQAMGETGPQLADAAGIPGNGTNGYSAPFVKYTYRNGQVVHYKLIGGDHGLRVSGSTVYADEAKEIVAAFLLQ